MNATTIHQALQRGAQRLASAGIDTPRLDAEVLLRHVLKVNRTRLFLIYPDPMPSDAQTALDALIERRIGGEPIAYLTGTREFMALSFRTTPDVLIPRPDTEPLVEWALEWLKDKSSARVADIGTGSGAIAVSLAAHLPPSFAGEIIGVDISERALKVARRNADDLLSPEQREHIRFIAGSLTEPLKPPVDLLLSNLPYLTPGQIAENANLVAEPQLALDGGPDGLDLIRVVVDDLPRLLSRFGAAGFEVDPSQISATVHLLHTAFPDGTVEVIHDLAGRQRHVVIQRG